MGVVFEVVVERGAIVEFQDGDVRQVGESLQLVRGRIGDRAADAEAADRRDVRRGLLDAGDQRALV